MNFTMFHSTYTREIEEKLTFNTVKPIRGFGGSRGDRQRPLAGIAANAECPEAVENRLNFDDIASFWLRRPDVLLYADEVARVLPG